MFAVPSLFVIRGVDQGSKFELRRHRSPLEREPNNTIQLHDTEISRRHAELRQIDGRYVLVDLNKLERHLHQRPPRQMQELVNGDQMQVGASVLLFTGVPDETTRGRGPRRRYHRGAPRRTTTRGFSAP